jgi:photosystem II stability/assembly factor-like uncharacterized protein
VLSYFKPLGIDKIGRIYTSSDAGNEWEIADYDLPSPPRILFKSRNGRTFASCSGKGLFYSDNIEVGWEVCRKGLFEKNNVYVCNIAADIDWTIYSMAENTKGTIYVIRGYNRLYASNDEGENWKSMSSPTLVISDLICDSKDNLYAATAMGIFKSVDGGKNWSSFSLGLTSVSINSVWEHPNGYLYAVSSDGNLFRTIDKILN